ncbi:MAG: pH regulation protein F [Candidatus Puniceispirillum sp.]|nr:pH regulation protein F [Candidatus Puniceispirillum sp.]MBL6775613.1 pH regulation protein F [Candidatus Puniceispirillum sp.]
MMMIVAMIACAVCLVLALVRTALGPTAFDRVLAVNAMGTLTILGISLHGFVMGRPEFVDIALLYAILNFIGTFAVLKIFSTGTLGDKSAGSK